MEFLLDLLQCIAVAATVGISIGLLLIGMCAGLVGAAWLFSKLDRS